jgi:hypothetical protein
LSQLGDDVLEIGRILDGGSRDPHQLATHRHQVESLLHTRGRIHRIAGQHRLNNDGMVSADDNPSVAGIANDDFAGSTPLMNERGRTVLHRDY